MNIILASEHSERDIYRSRNLRFFAEYIYIPYVVCETHFSTASLALRDVGGIRCHPFLTTGNEH